MNAAIRKIQRLDRQMRRLGSPRAVSPRPRKRGAAVEPTGKVPTYGHVWKPIADPAPGTPSPQRRAYESEADELYFGGGAGGGKSDMLLGLALTRHYRSIIFRREAEQVTGLEDRLLEILGTDAGYNQNKHRLVARVAGGKRRVRLAGMQRPGSWKKYQGQPYDLVAFDELPHFLRVQFRSIIGWNRTREVGRRCRVVCAGNPPTDPEGEWVIEEWAPWLDENHPDPAEPGELRWYRYGDDDRIEWYRREDLAADDEGLYVEVDGQRHHLMSRTFIPALVDDNPFYMATGYKSRLQALPEPLRSLMLQGKFGVESEDDPYQVIPTAWVKLAQARWRALHAEAAARGETFVPAVPMTALGVDVARGGKAETVLAPRHGEYVPAIHRYPGVTTDDGPAVAALIVQHTEDGAVPVVDVLGVGSAVEDALAANEIPFQAFVASETSTATDRSGKLTMANRRAEAWWGMRELLDPESKHELALPDDRRLRADLCAPRFRLTVRGILIEAKDDVKKRLGRSTDSGDAVVQAFAYKPKKRRHHVSTSEHRTLHDQMDGF